MNADILPRVPEVAEPSPLVATPMPADWLSDDEVRLLERVLEGRPPLMLSQQHEDRLIGGGYLAWEGGRLLPTAHTVEVIGHWMGGRRSEPRRAGDRYGRPKLLKSRRRV